MEKLVLTHIGRDNWNRPVYKDGEGQLFVDVDPRSHMPPELCTKCENLFDGEPDTPISHMPQYSRVRISFIPGRDVWK